MRTDREQRRRNLTHTVCRVGADGPLVIVSSHTDPWISNFANARGIGDDGEETGAFVNGYVGVTLDLRPVPGWVVRVDYRDGSEVARRAFREGGS